MNLSFDPASLSCRPDGTSPLDEPGRLQRAARSPVDVTAPLHQVRLRAFVGRSFHDKDEGLWREVEAVLASLKPLGFEFEDAKSPQPRPVSQKVREGIERNDIYIGVLSRRAALCDTSTILGRLWPQRTGAWSTSSWIVQEAGYALGRDRPVVLLIEDGVDFPTANLDADTEWIRLVRGDVAGISTKLVAMLAHFIAARLPESPTTQAITVAPPSDVSAGETRLVSIDNEAPAATEPTFRDVVALVDAGRLTEADSTFDAFKRRMAGDPMMSWLEHYYLAMKAQSGNEESLTQLQQAIADMPDNVDARLALAGYYRKFQDFETAAGILCSGLEAAAASRRSTLRRQIARIWAEAGKFAEAYKAIAEATLAERDDSLYVCLADVAKVQGNNELQAAALEKSLAIDPAAGERRFRLAFLYGDLNKDRMSLFHYTLRLAQGDNPDALNNLGVSRAALKLQSREIEAFEAASSANPLAKTNLSHAYIDRGFLNAAKSLADSVLHSRESDENATRRAAAALDRITSQRETEKQTERHLIEAARAEAAFRADYATAYIEPHVVVAGVFQTTYGDLQFRQTGSFLEGNGTFHEPATRGLFGSLAPESQAVMVERTVSFKAELTGRSGKLTVVETKQRVGGALIPLMPETSTVTGLVIVAPHGRTLHVLEDVEGIVKLYQAERIPETP